MVLSLKTVFSIQLLLLSYLVLKGLFNPEKFFSNFHYKSLRFAFHFSSNITFSGNYKWKKETRLATYNESADVFLVTNDAKKIFVAKAYKILDEDQIELLKKLKNTDFVEQFIDETKIYFD